MEGAANSHCLTKPLEVDKKNPGSFIECQQNQKHGFPCASKDELRNLQESRGMIRSQDTKDSCKYLEAPWQKRHQKSQLQLLVQQSALQIKQQNR